MKSSSALALVAAATIGCSDSQAPSFPSSWVADMLTQLLTMEVAIDGQTVSGTGALAGLSSTSSIPLVVTGTFDTPAMTLAFAGAPLGTIQFSGTYGGGGNLAGTLNGGGFTDRAVTFRSR